MPRLRNEQGVVVNVSDETAAALGAGWEPVKEQAEKKPARSSKTSK